MVQGTAHLHCCCMLNQIASHLSLQKERKKKPKKGRAVQLCRTGTVFETTAERTMLNYLGITVNFAVSHQSTKWAALRK